MCLCLPSSRLQSATQKEHLSPGDTQLNGRSFKSKELIHFPNIPESAGSEQRVLMNTNDEKVLEPGKSLLVRF